MLETMQLVAVICLLTAVPVGFLAVVKTVPKGHGHPKALEVAHTLAQAVKIIAFALLLTLISLFFAEPDQAFKFIVGLWSDGK